MTPIIRIDAKIDQTTLTIKVNFFITFRQTRFNSTNLVQLIKLLSVCTTKPSSIFGTGVNIINIFKTGWQQTYQLIQINDPVIIHISILTEFCFPPGTYPAGSPKNRMFGLIGRINYRLREILTIFVSANEWHHSQKNQVLKNQKPILRKPPIEIQQVPWKPTIQWFEKPNLKISTLLKQFYPLTVRPNKDFEAASTEAVFFVYILWSLLLRRSAFPCPSNSSPAVLDHWTLLKTASVLLPRAERIICLEAHMKQPKEAACYTACLAPVKCMALNLSAGWKKYWKK
jgi:hypothetical protein